VEEDFDVLSGLLFWRERVLLRVTSYVGGKVKSYKDLEIYKLSYDLAIKIHPVKTS